MKINQNFKTKILQEGGTIPADQQQQQQVQQPTQSEESVMDQILQVAVSAIQENNCEAAMAVCAVLVKMAQKQMQTQQAPAEPVMAKKGEKLVVKKRL